MKNILRHAALALISALLLLAPGKASASVYGTLDVVQNGWKFDFSHSLWNAPQGISFWSIAIDDWHRFAAEMDADAPREPDNLIVRNTWSDVTVDPTASPFSGVGLHTVTAYYIANGTRYDLAPMTYELVDPTATPPAVPDHGGTLGLAGLGAFCLAVVKRRLAFV